MKRELNIEDDTKVCDEKMKKRKNEEEEEEEIGFMRLDENLLFEVLKHVDAKTLAKAACVSKQWNKTAHDERLWELICTSQETNTGFANQQLRTVVLALGGFRRLHSLYLWPLLKPPSSSSSPSLPNSSLLPSSMIPTRSKVPNHWGKDEVHLSLSLLSIRYYEMMRPNTGSSSSSSSSRRSS